MAVCSSPNGSTASPSILPYPTPTRAPGSSPTLPTAGVTTSLVPRRKSSPPLPQLPWPLLLPSVSDLYTDTLASNAPAVPSWPLLAPESLSHLLHPHSVKA